MSGTPIPITSILPDEEPQGAAPDFEALFEALVPAIKEGSTLQRPLGRQKYCLLGEQRQGVPHRVSGLVIDFPEDHGGEVIGALLGGCDHGSYRHAGGRRVLLPLTEVVPPSVAQRAASALPALLPGARISYKRFEQPAGDAESLAPFLRVTGVRFNARGFLALQAQHALASKAPRVSSYAPEAFARLRRRAEGLEKPAPVPWPSLAKLLGGGMYPGMYALTGGTGSGKSQMVLQIGLYAAMSGFPVLYIGLELGKPGVIARISGLLTGHKWSGLYLGQDLTVLHNVERAVTPMLANLPFHTEFGDSHGWSYDRLRARCEQLVAAYEHLLRDADGQPVGPPIIILDFLQIVSSPEGAGRTEAIRERIARAAYAARGVARDLDAVVILVSSASRGSYESLGNGRYEPPPKKKGEEDQGWSRGKEIPASSFIDVGKESGEIEYGADVAMALVTEKAPTTPCPPGMSAVHIALAKGRAVRPGWVSLDFDGCSFHELSIGKSPHPVVGPDPVSGPPADPLDLSVG